MRFHLYIMCLWASPMQLDERALTEVMKKLFKNYKKWCKYLERKSSLWWAYSGFLPLFFFFLVCDRKIFVSIRAWTWKPPTNPPHPRPEQGLKGYSESFFWDLPIRLLLIFILFYFIFWDSCWHFTYFMLEELQCGCHTDASWQYLTWMHSVWYHNFNWTRSCVTFVEVSDIV